MAKKKTKSVELPSQYAVIDLPENAVEVTINAKVYLNGTLQDVTRVLNMQDIQRAFHEAEEGYIPTDAVFTLTDSGRQTAEQQEADGDAP